MARRVEGVTEKLLACAKSEFLEKGYEKASLRSIAEKAGSSKGAIYIRYPDKASLFSALVDEAADGLVELTRRMQEDFLQLPGDEQVEEVMERSDRGLEVFIEYLYRHFDEFRLLLTCSSPGVYSQFIHRFVSMDVRCTFQYVEDSGNDAIRKGRLNKEFAHILSEAFYTGVFQIVIHNMPREEGEDHLKRLRKFFAAGWHTVFWGE